MTDMPDVVEIVDEDDDLEEGEISDESVIEVETVDYDQPKEKKLPRRYTLAEKKVFNGKHKKSCKHISRHHKVKNKIKTSPALSIATKKHKSSCPRHSVENFKFLEDRFIPTKIIPPFIHTETQYSHSSSSSTRKSAFKNFTSPPRSALKSRKLSPNINRETGDNDSYPELLLEYKKSREHLSRKRKPNEADSQDKHSLPKSETKQIQNEKKTVLQDSFESYPSDEMKKINCVSEATKNVHKSYTKDETKKTNCVQNICKQDDVKKTNCVLQGAQNLCEPEAKKTKGEESEDEEELRRIALATCAKKIVVGEIPILDLLINENSSPCQPLSNQSSGTIWLDCDNGSSDNYDVVDMELDSENFVEDISYDNLYTIDTTPAVSSELKQELFNGVSNLNHDNLFAETSKLPSGNVQNLPTSQSESNKEFEVELLRAEAIASMNSKPKPQTLPKNPNPVKVELPKLPKKMEYSLPQKGSFKTSAVYSKGKLLNSVQAPIKRADMVKLNNLKLPNTKKVIPKSRAVIAGQKQMIITLNNDSSSSSDSSDEEEQTSEKGSRGNAAVSSIEALISDARQKSDIKTNGANSNHVSCLSKAQQEEYNSLKKLIAEKETMLAPPVAKETSIVENINLNLVLNEISVAKETLEKEMKVMNTAEKELLQRKQKFLTSKLKVQLLTKQLAAAQNVKVSELKAWEVCQAKYSIQKQSVSIIQKKIRLLETQLQLEQNSYSPLI